VSAAGRLPTMDAARAEVADALLPEKIAFAALKDEDALAGIGAQPMVLRCFEWVSISGILAGRVDPGPIRKRKRKRMRKRWRYNRFVRTRLRLRIGFICRSIQSCLHASVHPHRSAKSPTHVQRSCLGLRPLVVRSDLHGQGIGRAPVARWSRKFGIAAESHCGWEPTMRRT
jgi:hypothetical protein